MNHLRIYVFSIFILFQSFNISTINTAENGTSISTFEKDFGDWMNMMNVSSNSFTWHRRNLLIDHTMISRPGSYGYSMYVISYSGRAGTERIATDNEFMEPICLSLWYQIYQNSYDCSFSIFKISDENQALLFTAEGNSTSLGQWINISVDVYEQVPFKITLEAHFKYSNSKVVRAILVDDTSIAHRHCQDIPTGSKEPSTQNYVSDISTGFVMSPTPNNVSDITEGLEETPVESSIQFDIIGIAAGVSGGILLTITSVFLIYRLRRSNGCDCVTKNITSLMRKGQESRIKETGVYECSNIPSRLSDHAYDSFECANYYNMTNVPNSSTSGHHENDRDLYINQ
ncbi:uncharacterized protein LOC127709446 [Mytilus californianus]|uniref:uncharacterized protein LOC127709446 n=1 Tax=Mytilus californianus TaxID=6549 RepID=UPI002246546F|nr:uncharacterized protein LOC127709446 [Mytilus californianus]